MKNYFVSMCLASELSSSISCCAANRATRFELNVRLVDLQLLTVGEVTVLGEETSKKIYNWTKPSKNYPEGIKDDTHLNVEGAKAKCRTATG